MHIEMQLITFVGSGRRGETSTEITELFVNSLIVTRTGISSRPTSRGRSGSDMSNASVIQLARSLSTAERAP